MSETLWRVSVFMYTDLVCFIFEEKKMKTNKQSLMKTFLLLAVASATFTGVFANDENYLKSDPININGYVAEEVEPTDGELENVKRELKKQKTAIVVNKAKKKKYSELSKSTEKLADVTEDLIEERKESQVTIDKFNKKIDCLMSEGEKDGCEEYVKEDRVTSSQAAPARPEVSSSTAKHKHKPDETFGDNFKILPFIGYSTLMTENENFETNLSIGTKIESNISRRFAVGIGFAYKSMLTEDFGSGDYFPADWGLGYESQYGGREIEYTNMNVSMYAKMYVLRNDRFLPYIGAGIGYNRSHLKYTNNNSFDPFGGGSFGNNNFYSNGFEFGNEEVTVSNVNLELTTGSEVLFTQGFGMNVELNYKRAIGGNISSESGRNNYKAPDQLRLEDLSAELGDANIISFFVGLLAQF